MKSMERPGRMGRFDKDGPLNRHDRGELTIGILIDKNRIIVDFGTPVAWLGLRPDDARKLANNLLDKAYAMDGKRP